MQSCALAALLGEVLDRGERSHRCDDPVPSVCAVQGVTSAQYAQVKACMEIKQITPPERWTVSEGSKRRDVKFFLQQLQELEFFFETTVPVCLSQCGLCLHATWLL